jgi:hypothetical protein
MKNFLTLNLFSLFLLTGCVTTGFDDFYKPWHDEGFFPKEAYLKEGQEIKIIKTDNINEKFREIASRWYWCIGSSGFNGSGYDDYEIQAALTKLCKKEKASVAIWAHNFTHIDGATSFKTTPFTAYTSINNRYDYSAYLFIPIPYENRHTYTPGIAVSELSHHDREIYKQNTGALINIVYKNTAAYYANLTHGDIITKINGKQIITTEDYFNVADKSHLGDDWTMTIIRNGIEKEVKLVYNL